MCISGEKNGGKNVLGGSWALFGMLLNGKMVNGRTVGTCDAS